MSDGDWFSYPKWIVLERRLSAQARVTYVLLCSYRDERNHATVSKTALADNLGVSVSSVTRWLRELVEFGVLTVREEPGSARGNTYILHHDGVGSPLS